MFSIILMSYFQSVLMLYILFVAFNAIFNSVGLNVNALYLGNVELKVVFAVPAAQVLISLFFGGFVGSILSLVAFVVIYAYFTGRL